uniref:Reverse transcriptase domain-containing protein n=1 Tax=Cuerna arida TaxID=1464854 RepID=A0A1B6GDZ7_9HEMI
MFILYNIYLILKKNYKQELTSAKKIACEMYINKSKNKCKAAWDIISQEISTTRTPDVTLEPDTLNSYFADSAEELANQIGQTNTTAENLLGISTLPGSTQFLWSPVTPEEVIKTVSKFTNSKSMDPYWLSNCIIKNTIHLISTPLAYIFNKCLLHGYFPEQLKISKITPVYKKGDKTLCQNYRPISIVPILSKVFEALILKQLSKSFDSNNLLSEFQYGFRAGRSTTMAVSHISNSILNAFENKESVSMLLFDLTKAFDCIPFDILLTKLKFYGINNNSIEILKSYLTDRKQFVCIKGKHSSLSTIKAGVPQGSVLGPFLFIVAINDLPRNVPVDCVIYADDTTIFARDKDVNKLSQILLNAQDIVLNWFSANKLICNQSKTQSIDFSLRKNQPDQSVKLLGIHLDNRLSWKSQINKLSKKLSRVTCLFWKLKPLVSTEYLKLAYFGLFQSHIQYGILTWGHTSHVHDM